MVASEQEHQIKIAGVRHRPAAVPAQRQHHQFAARHAAMAASELLCHRRRQILHGGIGEIRQAAPHRERAGMAFDQLCAQLEAHFGCPAPHPVQPLFQAGIAAQAGQLRSQLRRIRQRRKGVGRQHHIEQRRIAGQRFG